MRYTVLCYLYIHKIGIFVYGAVVVAVIRHTVTWSQPTLCQQEFERCATCMIWAQWSSVDTFERAFALGHGVSFLLIYFLLTVM